MESAHDGHKPSVSEQQGQRTRAMSNQVSNRVRCALNEPTRVPSWSSCGRRVSVLTGAVLPTTNGTGLG